MSDVRSSRLVFPSMTSPTYSGSFSVEKLTTGTIFSFFVNTFAKITAANKSSATTI